MIYNKMATGTIIDDNESGAHMRIISVNSITGNEILARDIIMGRDLVLVTKGTRMKHAYIDKLRELEIEYIYVDDLISEEVKIENEIEYKVKESYQKSVKDIIRRFSSHSDNNMTKILGVIEDVIGDVIENKDILFSISYIREKSDSLYEHSLSVCTLSLLLAIKMDLSKDRLRDLAVGALLHDIGMAFVCGDYKNNPLREMLFEDVRETKKHITFGYTSVENISYISDVARDIILQHHERIDGKGYPFHLIGERIRTESKIVAVCDVFDCLVNGYFADKLKVHEAIDYIISRSSIKYDYYVVDAFHASVAAYPTGVTVITSDDEIAIVVKQNEKCPERPIIRLIKDSHGKMYHGNKSLDLTKELTIYIKDTLIH